MATFGETSVQILVVMLQFHMKAKLGFGCILRSYVHEAVVASRAGLEVIGKLRTPRSPKMQLQTSGATYGSTHKKSLVTF